MDGNITILRQAPRYDADAVAYDVRRRRGWIGTEIVGTVHAVDMTRALIAAKETFPDYWFVTPRSQRRPYEKVVQ